MQSFPHHQNVVGFVNLHEFENLLILAIEYAPGGTLTEFMKTQKTNEDMSPEKSATKLSEDHCSQILRGIMLGLKHVHDNECIHRDIKPSNIVFHDRSDMGSCRIIDFGLSVKINKNSHEINETCGTLIYQSPEQIFGEGLQGKTSDIFTCGFIMFELLTGKHPVLTRGEDKLAYRKRMKDFQGISVGKSLIST